MNLLIDAFVILADCSFGVRVRYEEDCCDCSHCSNVRRNLGDICCLHKQNQQCVVCVFNNPGKKNETDLDLDFVGGKNLTFFYTYHCICSEKSDVVVNLCGYVVSRWILFKCTFCVQGRVTLRRISWFQWSSWLIALDLCKTRKINLFRQTNVHFTLEFNLNYLLGETPS